MALVLAWLPDPVAFTRLRRAVGLDAASRAVHQIIPVHGWDQAGACAARSAPQILVFDPFESGPAAMEACSHFHARFPSVALLPYAHFAGRTHRQLLPLATLGIRAVVSRDEDDDPLTLREVLEALLTSTVVGDVLDRIRDVVPPPLLPMVRGLISAAHRPLAPREVAGRLAHRHPNTLREHLRAAGLPPVNKLIVWSRLFHAANLLADVSRSVENVAHTLEFPSPSALRNQLQRYAGLTPRQVRAGGGTRAVVERFLERYRTASWDVHPAGHDGMAGGERGIGAGE
jgi:AraC-like DNA-binding protein